MTRRPAWILAATLAAILLTPGGPLAPALTVGGTLPSLGRTYAAFPNYVRPSPVVLAATRQQPRRLLIQKASYEYIPPAKRTAFIVGINHAAGSRPLPGSLRDAENLRTALLGYGFQPQNITVLREQAATRPAILAGLRSLAARTPTTGIAVFGIATHTSRRGGTNYLRTAEGAQISAPELADRLREVHAPMWVALPTCYAGGYALPGIVGFNRVATFATSANQPTYQLGKAGSFLFIHMVRRGMIEGRAPWSVEDAFEFARMEIERSYPEDVPMMSDGFPGNLVLGPIATLDAGDGGSGRRVHARPSEWRSDDSDRYSYDGGSYQEDPSSNDYAPPPTPSPDSGTDRGSAGICGRFRYNCHT